jgi:hypothetical protein
MPLHRGAKPGSKEFGENVATEIEAGKPRAQAVAIAYAESRRKTDALKDQLRACADALEGCEGRVDSIGDNGVIETARRHLEEEERTAAKALRSLSSVGSGSTELTPDAVKNSSEYKVAKSAYDRSFAALRSFNQTHKPRRR